MVDMGSKVFSPELVVQPVCARKYQCSSQRSISSKESGEQKIQQLGRYSVGIIQDQNQALPALGTRFGPPEKLVNQLPRLRTCRHTGAGNFPEIPGQCLGAGQSCRGDAMK